MLHAKRIAFAWLGWWVALALLLGPGNAAAQEPAPIPALTARVIDSAGLLSDTQRGGLEQKLAGFEASHGTQIVLLLVKTTQPEDIATFAQRAGEAWKIGRRGVGDGLILVVARDDRRVRIEVAKALEGAVPDLAAKQIIDRDLSPAFKRGDYAGGLNLGVDSLTARIRGENLPAPSPQDWKGAHGSSWWPNFDFESLAVLFFVAVPIAGAVLTGLFGRKFGSFATSAGTGAVVWMLTASVLVTVLAVIAALLLVGLLGIGSRGGRGGRGGSPVIFGGGGGGWSGGGGSDGGGFSSGGGGDFGGGGASGDW